MSSATELPSQQDQPDWMRLARRGFDWGLLLVLALCFIASAPFLLRSDISTTNASENYVYRTYDYATAIQEGWLYPRWSSHVLGGYGAPIPNFYAPAAPYTAALFQILLTNSAVAAVRLLYVFATCMAGLAMYVLVMRHSGAAAGILAAMLYVYSPYMRLTVPHIQGDLPHMLILALTPALLWATDRIVRNDQPQNILLLVIISAALLLTDAKGAAFAYLLAGSFGLWQAAVMRSYRGMRQFVFGLFIGILLAGFYWIPALLEQSAIHWQANGSSPVIRLSLIEMIAPIQPIDPAEMVPYPQMTIGLITFLYAVGGALTSIALKRWFNFGNFFMSAGLVIATIAVTFAPSETDLLGFVLLCAAISGSDVLLLRAKLSTRPRRLTLPVLMITIWISSTAVWSPPLATEAFGSADGAAQVRYEQQGYGAAVLPAGEAIPSSVSIGLAPNPPLIDSYVSGDINKLAPGQITGSFRASLISHVTQGDVFQLVQASIPTTLNILTAYFPGWHASIGEQRLSLQANPTTGLIQVEVPVINSSNAELTINFGTTDIRYRSWIISGIALLITIIWTWRKLRKKRRNLIEDLALLKLDEARLIAVPVCCFGLVALLVLSPTPFISLTPTAYSGLQNSFSTQLRSTSGLNLSAFRLATNVYSAQDSIDLTLYWQTQRFLADNYHVKIFLVNNSDGTRWNETASRSPGFYPTKRWNTQQYVSDHYQFRFENGIPQGNYQIHVAAYTCHLICTTDDPLTFYDANGQPLGSDLILPTLISIQP